MDFFSCWTLGKWVTWDLPHESEKLKGFWNILDKIFFFFCPFLKKKLLFMLDICLEGLCCRVLHFTELLSCFGVVLHCIGLLCVALCYIILYCKVLKCISKAVHLKRNICLVSLPVTRKMSLSVKPVLVLSSVALTEISWLSGSANVGRQVGRHQEQDG